MTEEPTTVSGAALGRWLVLCGMILGGIVLYFWLAPQTRPVAPPSAIEDQR